MVVRFTQSACERFHKTSEPLDELRKAASRALLALGWIRLRLGLGFVSGACRFFKPTAALEDARKQRSGLRQSEKNRLRCPTPELVDSGCLVQRSLLRRRWKSFARRLLCFRNENVPNQTGGAFFGKSSGFGG